MLGAQAYAQDSSAVATPYHPRTDSNYRVRNAVIDSVAAAMAARESFVNDSIAKHYVSYPDSTRVNMMWLQIKNDSTLFYKGANFLDLHMKTKSLVKEGHLKVKREQWTIGVIIFLLLVAGIINRFMSKDVETVLQSFYIKRSAQVGKEESLLNSQAFFVLFILFGLISGLFIYQVSVVKERYYPISGFQLFGFLAIVVVALFALKLLVLRVIGFIFDMNKIVGDYISILYLTYFNIAFVFLPLTLCFCLLPVAYSGYVLDAALLLAVVIFVWQYLRSSVNIISNFRFHKFYLFIYLCALEICPVLILVKALNI